MKTKKKKIIMIVINNSIIIIMKKKGVEGEVGAARSLGGPARGLALGQQAGGALAAISLRVKVINTHRERKYTPSRQREGDLNKSISQQTHIEKENIRLRHTLLGGRRSGGDFTYTTNTHRERKYKHWRRFHIRQYATHCTHCSAGEALAAISHILILSLIHI